MRVVRDKFVEKYSWIEGYESVDTFCEECFFNRSMVCRHPKRIFEDLDIQVIEEYIEEGLNIDEICEALGRDREHLLSNLRSRGVRIGRANSRGRKSKGVRPANNPIRERGTPIKDHLCSVSSTGQKERKD